jgi:energy-coupling factor transport system permease protein
VITPYQAGTSLIHRLHPLTKLVLGFAMLIIALAAAGAWLPLALYAVLLIVSAVARVARAFVRTSLVIVLPFAVSLFVIQSLFFAEGSTVLARLGPFTVKEEGVLFAFAGSVRILAVAGALVLVLLTTHPGVLLAGLVQKGVPPQLAYIIATTLQIVPQLQARAQQIGDAQRARGLRTEGSLPLRARALLALAGPLVIGALLDVEERTLALEARAFNAPTPKTSLFDVPDTALDRVLRWGVAVLLGTLLVVWLTGALR